MNLNLHNISFFQKLNTLNLLSGNRNLIKCFCVHKIVSHFILIKILKWTTLNTNFVNFYSRVESFINHSSGGNILKFSSYKSSTFTRFYMKKLCYKIVLPI